MTGTGQHPHVSAVIAVAVLFARILEGEERVQNEEDGFCFKSIDGIKCVSQEAVRLTRLESGQVRQVLTFKRATILFVNYNTFQLFTIGLLSKYTKNVNVYK